METASVVLSGTEPIRELHRDTYDKYVTKDEDRCERGVSGVWRLAFGVWRLAFGVWRLAFGVWRLAFGLIVKKGAQLQAHFKFFS
jgi:hypothetical protein